jgi:hypothetical protein
MIVDAVEAGVRNLETWLVVHPVLQGLSRTEKLNGDDLRDIL